MNTAELQVLLATITWLHDHGWQPKAISPASGKGLPPIEESRERVVGLLQDLDIYVNPYTIFKSSGPDIIAVSSEGIWKFECKGYNPGVASSTAETNFKRALASVVSYFDNEDTRLGLSIDYRYLFKHRFSWPSYSRVMSSGWKPGC